MDGRVGFSIHLPATVLKTRTGLRLKDGEIVSVRVDGRAAAGRYAVTLKGITVDIRSTRALEAGAMLKARVSVSGGRIVLKILGPPLPSTSVSSLVSGLPPLNLSKEFTTLIVQSLQRSSMPISPEAVVAVSSMVPHLRRKEVGLIRFAVILHDKNLHVVPEQLEEMYRAISGEGGSSDREGSRRETAQDGGAEEQGKNQPSEGRPETGGDPRVVVAAAAGERTVVGAQLRSQSMGSSGGDIGWTALFNQTAGKHESWVIVPFRVGGEAARVDGSVRLLLDTGFLKSRGGRIPPVKVAKAAVAVSGIGTFEFLGSPPARMVFHAESLPEKSKMDPFLPELAEKLRNLGVEIDDTNNGGAVYDGFSAETHEIRGVDASA